MSSRDSLPLTVFITRRKLLSSKTNLLVFSGFLLLLVFFWLKGSFVLSFRLFLFLFPHFFLFLSQGMIRDEVDSGALDNLLFLEGRFRSYLGWKHTVSAGAALGAGLILFTAFAFYGLATRQFAPAFLLQFAAGILAGVYYQALAGFLSFFLKAGANVLIVILTQVLVLFGLLVSAAHRPGWIDTLASSSHPGLPADLGFLTLAAVAPNIIVVKGFWFSILGLAAVAGLLFGFQLLKIGSLELRKR